jgi:hypothetical protein
VRQHGQQDSEATGGQLAQIKHRVRGIPSEQRRRPLATKATDEPMCGLQPGESKLCSGTKRRGRGHPVWVKDLRHDGRGLTH